MLVCWGFFFLFFFFLFCFVLFSFFLSFFSLFFFFFFCHLLLFTLLLVGLVWFGWFFRELKIGNHVFLTLYHSMGFVESCSRYLSFVKSIGDTPTPTPPLLLCVKRQINANRLLWKHIRTDCVCFFEKSSTDITEDLAVQYNRVCIFWNLNTT